MIEVGPLLCQIKQVEYKPFSWHKKPKPCKEHGQTLQRKCISVILPLVARVSVNFSRLSNLKPTADPVQHEEENFLESVSACKINITTLLEVS